MDISLIRKKGLAAIDIAISHDNEKQYQEAFNYYVQGIGQLILAIKYEKNNNIKTSLLIKIKGYIDRAEQLKGINKTPSSFLSEIIPVANQSEEDAKEDAIDKTKINGKDIQVTWDDIVGLNSTKALLYDTIILPKKFPSLFTGKRKPWSAILLYGPPGTGKSFLAKAVAHESGSMFFSISSSDIVSKWQGESEKTVTTLFKKARASAPAVIFIDEVDSLAGVRSDGEQESTRRIKTQLLTEMQGVSTKDSESLLVLAATNTPWTLDGAFRRRFQKRIYVPLPDKEARGVMFKKELGTDIPHSLNDSDFKLLAEITDGYSGSDITNVVRSAMMEPIRKCRAATQFIPVHGTIRFAPSETYPNCINCPKNLSYDPSRGKVCEYCGAHCKALEDLNEEALEIPPVTLKDMFSAIDSISKTVSVNELGRFDEWTREFGQDGS